MTKAGFDERLDDPLEAMRRALRIKVAQQMQLVEQGRPLHLAAADIGMMPFELLTLANGNPR